MSNATMTAGASVSKPGLLVLSDGTQVTIPGNGVIVVDSKHIPDLQRAGFVLTSQD